MSNHGQIYIELSVSYADDPKVAALARWPEHARGARDLYVQMICYAKQNLTDGHVPAEMIGKLAYPDPAHVATTQVGLLSEVSLVDMTPNGWVIRAYLTYNKSRDEVRQLSQQRAEAGRAGGRKSGAVRVWGSKTEANAKQVASFGLNTETETETETETLSLLLTADAESVKPRPKTALSRRESEMFGQWWQEWPRKVARAAAEVAFKKALSNVAFQDLMNATRRYRNDPNREQQFTPYPATWLNRGQWTDEPEPPRTSGRAPASPPDRQMIPNEAGRMVPDPYDNWMNQ